jgi:hypothetical protein
MDISLEDAQGALDLVEAAQNRLRKAISASYASNLLILWGGITLAGFVALHFLGGPRGGFIYTLLDLVGVVVTAYFLRRAPHRTALRGSESRIAGWHLWGFWLALALYGTLWALVLKPSSSSQLSAFLLTLIMFAYVVMGLWFMSYFMVWLGLSVTVLTMVGYILLPAYFHLWTGVLAGSALCGTGVYIRRCWR